MKSSCLFGTTLTSVLFAVAVAACGDNGTPQTRPDARDIDAAPADAAKPTFSRMVTFGDSLSDVGTYKVGTVATLNGGKYTVNAATPTIWVEQLSAQMGLPTPCAAQTGLDGDVMRGFKVAVVNHPGCTNYAQGGSRITNPVGPGNKALGGANAVLGQLTVPVVTQLQSHLATAGGSFGATDLVTVLAGGNEVIIHAGLVGAQMETPAAAATALGIAGGELATLIKLQVLSKGAKYVVVVNMPNVSVSPFAAAPGPLHDLVLSLSAAFNMQLSAGLAGADVLLIDAFASSGMQVANPATFGISNAIVPACDLAPAKNPLGSSLVCSAGNVITGDISKYLFADSVHPTPFGHSLLAKQVSDAMKAKGWL